MDAISDVSRASQIFSSVPSRLPLPDPLDLDVLLGFSEGQLNRTECDIFSGVKHFDNNKIFINEVDSFCGKYLALLLSRKETLNEPQEIVKVVPVEESNTQLKNKSVSKKGNKSASEKKSKDKSKKRDTSPKSAKNVKTKTSKRMSSAKPIEDVSEKIECMKDIFQEKSIKYDTSRLTVAEYYEWLDLEPGSNRDDFLKDKLEKNLEDQKMDSNIPTIIHSMDVKPTLTNQKEIKQYYIIGTLKNKDSPEGYVQEGVNEIIERSEDSGTFYEQISKCGFIIYFINEHHKQSVEALKVFNSLLNYLDENCELAKAGRPFFILVSTFMCWASTKPLDPNNSELPFTEKDYRKRIPHLNYQVHYELEQQVIKATNNNKIDSIILTCGIPYGHEETVFSYLFETAYTYEDLSIYGLGNNLLPIIHVENMALVIREVIRKRYEINLPFLFINDRFLYSFKELVNAISIGYGSGCYRVMPVAFAFLDDSVSQDIYDQTTFNINLQSCYPLVTEEDVRWRNKNGFIDDIKFLIDEFIEAKGLPKPLCIILFGSDKPNVRFLICKYYNIPYLSIDHVVKEYISNMIDKLQGSNRDTDTKPETTKHLEREDSSFGSDIQGKQECENIFNLDKSFEIFKKLNVKEFKDVGNLSDTQKANILKEKLKENLCIYHGYLLNDFPQTLHQAEVLFSLDERKNLEEGMYSTKLKFPDYIVYLNESQVPVVDHDLGMRENDINNGILTNIQDDTHGEHVLPGMANMESLIVEDIPIMKYFQKINNNCKIIEIQISESDDSEKIFKTIISEIEETNAAEHQSQAFQESTYQEVLKESNVPERDVDFNDLSNTDVKNEQFKSLKEKEEIILSIRSYPLLNYLINFVYPTLTNALLEVSDHRPEDPLDFLAEYLFKKNPHGRMIDPYNFKSKEAYQDLGFPNIDSKTCLS